jgi:hypothetical protein
MRPDEPATEIAAVTDPVTVTVTVTEYLSLCVRDCRTHKDSRFEAVSLPLYGYSGTSKNKVPNKIKYNSNLISHSAYYWAH